MPSSSFAFPRLGPCKALKRIWGPILAHLVGAFWEDQLVGYAGMWQVVDEAHITNIAVLPGYRGRGIGRMLLEALLKDANVRGARSATLEVRPSNIAALALRCV